MADKVIIFEADIDVSKAIAEQKKLIAELDAQKKKLEELKEAEGDNTDAIIKQTAEVKLLQKELKQQEAITQKVIASNKQSAGSIDQLSNELAVVTKSWNALSEEERENTEEGKALTKQKTELTKKLSELRQATGDSRMEVGKYKDITISLKLELRENIKALAQMKAAGEDNTEAYQKLLKTTGELQDTIADTREEVKRYASDTQTLDMAIGVFRGIGSAAQVAEGASALLGDENEQLTKSIQKMVAIQSIMNGLQEIQNALQKESSFMMGLNTVKTEAMAAAQALYTTAVGTSTGAMKVFRTALLATGIGAIIAGIVLLVTNWDKLTDAISKSSAEAEKYAQKMENVNKINEANLAFDKFSLEIVKARGATSAEITKQEIQNNKNRQAAIEEELLLLEEIGKLRNKSEEESKQYNDLLGEQLEKKDEAILLSLKLEKELGEEEAKRVDAAIKANRDLTKMRNDVNDALLKSEQKFFEEVEKIRTDIVARDLKRIEDYNNDIFGEYEEELANEEQLNAKKSQLLLERLNTDFENEMAILEMNEATKFEARKMWLDAQKAEELRKAEETGANIQLINDKYRALDLELERAKTDAKLQLSADFMGNLSTLFGEGTALGKAFAITETIINTYKGAQAAYASLSTIPIVGPGLGAAAASAQIKVGFDSIKKIKAAGKGGGGGDSASTTTASAPVLTAATPSISMSAISGSVGTSTANIVGEALTKQPETKIAVVVDDVTAKQNLQAGANKMGVL